MAKRLDVKVKSVCCVSPPECLDAGRHVRISKRTQLHTLNGVELEA